MFQLLSDGALLREARTVMIGTVLLIILVLLLLGVVPRWPYSANWGYGPSGLLGLILVVVLVLVLMGRI